MHKTRIVISVFLLIIGLLSYHYAPSSFLEESDIILAEKNNSILINENQIPNILNNKISKTNSLQCSDFSFSVDNIQSWKKDKKSKISKYLAGLINEGVDRNILDQVYVSSGIGWTFGRNLDNSPNDLKSLSPYFETQIKYSQSQSLIIGFVKNLEYIKLLELYATEPNQLNKSYFSGDGDILPIISYLIKFSSKGSSNDIYEVIKSLSLLGEKIRYIDLITATKYNHDVIFIERLFALSGLRSDKTFEAYSDYETLSTIAAKHNNVAALLFWLRLGSSPTPDPLIDNALDLLKAPINTTELALHTEAFLFLMKQNVHANSILTYTELSTWLPVKYLKTYENQLNGTDKLTFSKEEQGLIRQYISELFYIVTDKGSILPNQDRSNTKCIFLAGKKLTDIIFSVEVVQRQEKKHEQVIPNTSQDLANEVISNFTQSGINTELEYKTLKNRTDLIGKLAYSHIMKEKVLDKIRAQRGDPLDDAEVSSVDKTLRELVFTKKEYHLAYDLIHHSEMMNNERLMWFSLILSEVINNQFDVNLIEQLINSGAFLNPMILFSLIENHDLNAVQVLRKKGLDIHYVNPFGRNAIWYCIEKKSVNLLRYFILSNVEINLPPHGIDALDIAISQLAQIEDGMHYIDLLIDNGVNIHQSHRTKIAQLKVTNKNLYAVISERHPELI